MVRGTCGEERPGHRSGDRKKDCVSGMPSGVRVRSFRATALKPGSWGKADCGRF